MWCLTECIRCCPDAKWTRSCVCKSHAVTSGRKLRTDREGAACSSIRNGKIWSYYVWTTHCGRKWPQTTTGNSKEANHNSTQTPAAYVAKTATVQFWLSLQTRQATCHCWYAVKSPRLQWKWPVKIQQGPRNSLRYCRRNVIWPVGILTSARN